ncbi:MAG: mnmH [Segetibacter sp.]|nr:mnmH [Segetibacter sp.]
MAVQKLNIEAFIKLANEHPVIDVRSPDEFEHAHIPGAYSLPLFTNEERKVVGTIYKQESRENAIKKGLEYFGVKMRRMVEEVEKLLTGDGCQMTEGKELRDDRGQGAAGQGVNDGKNTSSKTVLVHCWRGGMRSAGVAWLLDLYGFKVYTLVGGYKVFRQWVLKQFEKEYPFKILGGFTGSGKTMVLAEMKKNGVVVIDLENLAHHKGSAFGGINMPVQPTQEMFENKLAVELGRADDRSGMTDDGKSDERNHSNSASPLSSVNIQSSTFKTSSTAPIWLEDESQRIGNVNIPMPLWRQIRTQPVVFLNIPFEERLKYILEDYGKGDRGKLVDAVNRIKKRLGGLETKTAINFLMEDNLTESFRVLLQYYDKQYLKGLQSRENVKDLVTELTSEKVDAAANAEKILNTTKELNA